MANIILGCDLNSVSSDQKNQSTVAKILEDAGHSVEKLAIGANNTQSRMQQSSSKGKIAIYMVNGADLQTYRDFHDGITQGYYHAKYAYFGLQGYISPTTCSCKGAKTAKLQRAHDDQSPVSYTAALVGMTTAQVCEKYKKAIAYACGSSPEELGKNLVKVIGGGSNSDGDGGESSSSTIKDALKQAVSGWDGDVEINLIDDTVYVNKIKDPTTAELTANEYENVQYDSVTVTDLNPQTPNKVVMNYDGQNLCLKDDIQIARFEEIEETIEIPEEEKENIKSYDDAVAYLQRVWNKIRRDDARQVELKVDGDAKWRTGKWVRVYLPSFFIDDYMYITRVSHEEDNTGNWTVSLTLVDYPPSFGTYEETENTDEEDEETDEEGTDETTTEE